VCTGLRKKRVSYEHRNLGLDQVPTYICFF
jgi:hypothetical protein